MIAILAGVLAVSALDDDKNAALAAAEAELALSAEASAIKSDAATAESEANAETILLAAAPEPVLQLDAGSTTGTEAETALTGTLADAAHYASFHRTVADLRDAPIASGDDLDAAMDRLSAYYGEDRLARAWVAYTALIAAQHPDFIDEVREAADFYGTDAAMEGLVNDPTYITSFSTAETAEQAVAGALESDADEIRDVAEQYRMAAYNLQNERWANVRAQDRQDRLTALETAGERDLDMNNAAVEAFQAQMDTGRAASQLFRTDTALVADASATTGAPALTLAVGQGQLSADENRVGRVLSVAALQSISDDPMATTQALEALMTDPTVERCLAWVRLDMQQCVAAGHFKYEDSFCIAEHALLDVSNCLSASNG